MPAEGQTDLPKLELTGRVPQKRGARKRRGERMEQNGITRRDWLKTTGASMAALAVSPMNLAAEQQAPQAAEPVDPDRARRMQWWHAAKFGMFIHWGLY